MTNLDSSQMTKAKRDKKACDARHQRQQVVGSADTFHSLEELPSIEDADAVKEHDQSGQTDRPDDLCLGSKCAESQPDEQHGADPKRKSTDADLTDQVTQPDGQKRGEDWLRLDDPAGQVDHDRNSPDSDFVNPQANGRGTLPCGTARELGLSVQARVSAYRHACTRDPSPSI